MPKAAVPLTARDLSSVIKVAKDAGKPKKTYDGAGLFIEAFPNGKAFWRLKHSGGLKTDTLGRYPEMSLKQAREAAIESRRLIAQGINPVQERRAERVAAVVNLANTFKVKAEEWLEEQTKLGKLEPGTISRHQSRLETFVYPKLGSRPIDEITGPELLQVLNEVCDQDKAHTAERIRQLFSQIVKKKVPHIPDVAASIKGQIDIPEGGHLPGITDPTKFAALLRVIDNYDGTYPTKVALKLSAMLFTRPGELRKMEWSELNLDTATWIIPESKMKTRSGDHIVPLPKQAVELLQSLKPYSGEGRYVFTTLRGRDRPMSENTVNKALQRMDYDTGTVHCAHGFRTSASTLLNGERFKKDGTKLQRWSADVIERQLAHETKGVRGIYNRNQYIEERREMMSDWADYLDMLKAG
jgi:integrase